MLSRTCKQGFLYLLVPRAGWHTEISSIQNENSLFYSSQGTAPSHYLRIIAVFATAESSKEKMDLLYFLRDTHSADS